MPQVLYCERCQAPVTASRDIYHRSCHRHESCAVQTIAWNCSQCQTTLRVDSQHVSYAAA